MVIWTLCINACLQNSHKLWCGVYNTYTIYNMHACVHTIMYRFADGPTRSRVAKLWTKETCIFTNILCIYAFFLNFFQVQGIFLPHDDNRQETK